ncbi:MAG: acyltransferase [Candidatus Omnitrophica bacterium]|nr:acyltransferase [Candidatus Omnitrophota bacterium]
MKRIFCYLLYYFFAKNLPRSYELGPVGKMSGRLRRFACRRLFQKTEGIFGVERGADFGGGRNIIMREYGSLGENLRVMGEGTVTVGRHVMMGPDVLILTSDHKADEEGFDGYVTKDVLIDDHAWIGARAIILKGVRVGKHAIVGAGAVVARHVQDHEVVIGNPAKVLRVRVPPPDDRKS